jgi:hypothetical protein
MEMDFAEPLSVHGSLRFGDFPEDRDGQLLCPVADPTVPDDMDDIRNAPFPVVMKVGMPVTMRMFVTVRMRMVAVAVSRVMDMHIAAAVRVILAAYGLMAVHRFIAILIMAVSVLMLTFRIPVEGDRYVGPTDGKPFGLFDLNIITPDAQLPDLTDDSGRIEAKVDQGPEAHVPADSRKAVKV